MNYDQAYRYSRQMIPGQLGEAEQKKIGESTVFIAGAGGLGTAVAVYLASAGVGYLRICDFDKIELSNLNRQILYTEKDIGKPKVARLKQRLIGLNHFVKIVPLKSTIKPDNVADLVADAEIVVDCLDNYQARLILNQHSIKNQLPLVHAGVQDMIGQLTFLKPPETPCMQCIYSELTDNSSRSVIGAAAGTIGSLQALEVIKFITGIGQQLMNKMLVWDGENNAFNVIPLKKKNNCKCCSDKIMPG